MEVTTEAIVQDIRAVASKLSLQHLSRSEYLQHGKYSAYRLYDGGRTWGDLSVAAGVQTKTKHEPVPDDVYYDRLCSAIESLGRYPKVSERKKLGLNFSNRRWPTLSQFIEAARQKGIISSPTATAPPVSDASPHQEETRRREATKAQTATRTRTVIRGIPPIPERTRRRKWQRIGMQGFPYAPHDELGVVALFAILCSSGRIPWQILELNGGRGIDVTVYDHAQNHELRVELKHLLSRSSWNHSLDDLDYVVCWENRWPEFPKQVIELRKLIEDLTE